MKRNSGKKVPQRILVIDIGGTNLKVAGSGHPETLKIPSGPKMNAAQMVRDVKNATKGWGFQAVSIGYPGLVVNGRPVHEPHNLAEGWVGFDFRRAFGCPVKVINDAAMQALGSYEGGSMLFLGLGTGLGSAMVHDGILEPMELAHLAYRKGKTYEDYAGLRGLEGMGRKKWQKHVTRIVNNFREVLGADFVVLGGGNAKKLKALPPKCKLGDNSNAIKGGLRLWQPPASLR
jgi:predicted NBD/HSP70 family sugar kinase